MISDSHDVCAPSAEFENRLSSLRLELLAESIANLSHDLSGALMGIGHYGELLEAAPPGSGERNVFLERQSALHDRAASLVRQLRRVSSLRSSARPTVLRELAESAASIVQSTYKRDAISLVIPDFTDASSLSIRQDEATQALVFVLHLARLAAVPVRDAGESPRVELRVLDDGVEARSIVVLATGCFELEIAERRALLVAMLDRACATLEEVDEGRLLIRFPLHVEERGR